MLSKKQTKLIGSLKFKKFRIKHNLFIAEGVKTVSELLGSPLEIRLLFATKSAKPRHWRGKERSIEVCEITEEELKSISSMATPNEVICAVKIPEYGLDLKEIMSSLNLVLDNINDPGNLGTIIRIADWFGIQNIICSENCVDVYNPKVVQATMGSIARIKVHYVDLVKFLTEVKNKKEIREIKESENQRRSGSSENPKSKIQNPQSVLWSVNTSFSCLAVINDDFSFIPRWKPSFITKLASEDRCHLNGMAMDQGLPLYVSAFGTGNKPQSWRENIPDTGVVIHVPSSEIVLKDLPMPHSPRIYNDKLYMLLSATGEVVCADPEKGKYEVITKLQGFVRGMDKYGDHLFIGLSRLRKNASTFKDLPIADKALSAGIVVIHIPTGGIVGELKYQSTVDEIYDIQVLPDLKRPGILNTMNDTYKMGLSTPDATYWAASEESSSKQLIVDNKQ